jgi:hypothetical protein
VHKDYFPQRFCQRLQGLKVRLKFKVKD